MSLSIIARLRFMLSPGKHRQHGKPGRDYRMVSTQNFERMFSSANYRERMRFGQR